MKNVAEQTKEILKNYVENKAEGNITKASLSLGLNPDSNILRKWVSGERTPSLSSIAPVFEVLGVELKEPDENLEEYDLIPKVSALAGAGALSLETSGEHKGLYAFRKDFLAMQCISAKNSVLLDVTGDSMEPLLKNGDTILVDQSDRNVSDGGIYLVTLFESLLVKQIVLGVRSIILHSLNPMYPDTTVGKEDIDSLIIHGRMRWAARCF